MKQLNFVKDIFTFFSDRMQTEIFRLTKSVKSDERNEQRNEIGLVHRCFGSAEKKLNFFVFCQISTLLAKSVPNVNLSKMFSDIWMP